MNADSFISYIKLIVVNNSITIHKTDSDNDDFSLKKCKMCQHSSVYTSEYDKNYIDFNQNKAHSN